MKKLTEIQRTLYVGLAEAMRIQKLMCPKTDRIMQVYGETKDHELLKHAQRMEDGLHAAVRELERVNNINDGQPLVSHNLLNSLRGLVA